MSYDLFFRARTPSAKLTLETFNAYFSGRPNFELKAAQAWYSNEETGVYFSFDYSEPESDDAWLPRLPVSLNVNYFRPHTFGLEAQLELALFVKHFELTVVDPQNSGMGEGEYSREGFLRGWNAGNEVAYEALVERNPTATYPSLPVAQLEAAWLWNYSVPTRQRDVGDNVFVPRIFFVALGHGPPLTAAVWGDGIPVLLPDVDFYFLPRKRLAPKPLPSSAKPELTHSTRAELAPLLSGFKKSSDALTWYQLDYLDTPAEIERFVRQARLPAERPTRLAFDRVLDRELLERARRARG